MVFQRTDTAENHAHKKDSSSYLGLISAALSPHHSSPLFLPPPETIHHNGIG